MDLPFFFSLSLSIVPFGQMIIRNNRDNHTTARWWWWCCSHGLPQCVRDLKTVLNKFESINCATDSNCTAAQSVFFSLRLSRFTYLVMCVKSRHRLNSSLSVSISRLFFLRDFFFAEIISGFCFFLLAPFSLFPRTTVPVDVHFCTRH